MVMEKIMEYKEGDIITITVDGRTYDTYIDEDGVQRFRTDPTHLLWDRWKGDEGERRGRGTEDLNTLAIAYANKEFDQRTFMEFNMSLGYSVSGFCELHNFFDLNVVNPIWGESEDDEPNDIYISANLCSGKLKLEEALQMIMKREQIVYTKAQDYVQENFINSWY